MFKIFASALKQSFVSGSVTTSAGPLPQILSTLNWHDHWGTVKARFGTFRMNYSVGPGLYALGNPDNNSPVFGYRQLQDGALIA